jgi:hypothetical protein
MGIIEDTRARIDNYLSMSGIFSASPDSTNGTSQTNIYGGPIENQAAQETTAMMMSTDIEQQAAMEDAAKGTGIGTVGSKSHFPGQGPGEIGVVGAIAHSPGSGRVLLPSEQVAKLQQDSATLDSMFQQGQIDQATYNANQADILARGAALVRYPSVANMYPTAGAPTKFQSAMDAALGQVAAYKASKDAGQATATLKLGGNIVQQAVVPVQQQVQQVQQVQVAPKASPTTFLTAVSNAAKNITRIIGLPTQSTQTPSAAQKVVPQYNIEALVSNLKSKQNIITLPAITMMPGQSINTQTVQQPKSGQTLKSLTSVGQSLLKSQQPMAMTNISLNAVNAAKAQLANTNSIVGISAATKAATVIPITQQAQAKMNLANAIVPNSVAKPIVSNQVQSQASLVNRISAFQSAAISVKTNVAQPVTNVIQFKTSAPVAAKSSYTAPVAARSSTPAVTISKGVAYIGSVGRGK